MIKSTIFTLCYTFILIVYLIYVRLLWKTVDKNDDKVNKNDNFWFLPTALAVDYGIIHIIYLFTDYNRR